MRWTHKKEQHPCRGVASRTASDPRLGLPIPTCCSALSPQHALPEAEGTWGGNGFHPVSVHEFPCMPVSSLSTPEALRAEVYAHHQEPALNQYGAPSAHKARGGSSVEHQRPQISAAAILCCLGFFLPVHLAIRGWKTEAPPWVPVV